MASLLYPDEDQSQWPTSLLPVDDGTPPVLQADPRADALGQTYRAITEAIERQGGQAFMYANNPIGTETTRPEQTVSMPRDFVPAGTVGGGLWGDERPIAQRDVDAFRAGSEDLYNQASLLGGSRGVFEPPGGGGGAVTLASRRPLANPPPSTRGLLDVPTPPSEPPPTPPPFFINYHGSPHDFPPTARNPLGEFDPAKIGTGEGNQAYGVGAGYTADAEGVARGYRDALTPQTIPNPEFHALHTEYNTADAAAREAIMSGTEAQYQAAVAARDAARAKLAGVQAVIPNPAGPQGHMYEVKINADPEHFLDWDKPLSEQHPVVQQALASIKPGDVGLTPVQTANGIRHITSQGFEVGPRIYDKAPGDISLLDIAGDRGMSAVENLANWTGGHANASELLQKAGIPGIRYLDAGSRGAGEGSRNSVVFDAATMEIIRKYGLAGLMAGGGAAALSGQQGQQQQ